MRYFLIFWVANGGSDSMTGDAMLERVNGFPNRSEFKKDVLLQYPKMKTATITNIIELSEEDYKNWTR